MHRLSLALVTLVAACSFQHGVVSDGTHDGGGDDGGPADVSTVPDASICEAATIDCVSDTVLRFCQAVGVPAIDRTCNWGCLTMSATVPTPHCAELVPSADAVRPADAKSQGLSSLGDVNLTTGIIINGSTGEIGSGVTPNQLHDAMVGVKNGIDYEIASSSGAATAAAIFRFKKLTISGNITLTGSRPMVLIADDVISIGAIVDARGPCTNLSRLTSVTPHGGEAGPGGFRGGAQFVIGDGPGGGGPGRSGQPDEGGAGGGNGGAGGTGGGPGGTAGIANNVDIPSLVGGSGGGGAGGGGGHSESGGGGGGAVQIISNKRIDISAGGINAGGCGGFSTSAGGPDGGAGGGAGGTILLEAPSIVFSNGALAVNGGGGGAGASAVQLQGENGRLDRTPATGATSSNGAGGAGGAGATLDGTAGAVAGGKAGGGGGAVGRIKFVTRGDMNLDIKQPAVLSPGQNTTATTHAPAATE